LFRKYGILILGIHTARSDYDKPAFILANPRIFSALIHKSILLVLPAAIRPHWEWNTLANNKPGSF
jgi:hypothetical protein